MSEQKEFTPDLPWTIERQLKAYAIAEGHTDRHEILYHTWKQNKRWFSRILEYTIDSYPKYSQHNANHCQAVIHNIESLLGEDEIKRLSPTDSYALLTAVYMHDVGMCITWRRKVDIVSSNVFLDWIDQEFRSFNTNLLDHISNLRRNQYEFEEDRDPVKQQANYKKLYGQKLDTADSTEQLISEFQRRVHAEESSNWMKKEILESSEINYGLSITGIPKRIHLSIADCAMLHGIVGVEELIQSLMAMRQEDNGFASDLYHPRFIAVLLLIGDALDIDNDRFHPYARTMAGGNLGESSETHYRKHQAIRSLQVTPKMIFIRADCEKPAEMRMLRNDINWLQRFITECSYQWSKIAPNNYCGYLPRVDFEQISLGGKRIAEKLVKAQFHLSQQKAFKLLEGASLYDNHFVYLREMLQNAMDAIKFQYWNDLDATEFNANPDVGLCEANDELPLRRYPIKINFAIRKRRKGRSDDLLPVTLDDIMDPDSLAKYDLGVQVCVQDCGIGIGEDDIVAISKVGSSQDHRRSLIQSMPAWLLPTGKFGIGLQSLFQADRVFTCITRTHQDECYEITFHSGTNNEGYINVIPKDWKAGDNGSVPYGTKFMLFVPHELKESHSTNMSGWAGMDPYAEDYIRSRFLRRSVELMKQMEAKLEEWVGECLFPVVIREELLDISLRQAGWEERLAPRTKIKMDKIAFQRIDPRTHREESQNTIDSCLCWLFTHHDNDLFLRGDLTDKSASYYMDDKECTLHIWSQEANCFFACNSRRIVQAITKEAVPDSDQSEEQGRKIKIFLKGLLINELTYEDDELIEYIDIKNNQLQEHLYMSRNAFSTKGENIIKNDIIPLLQKTFRNVLNHINQTAIMSIAQNRRDIMENIVDHYRQINFEENEKFSETDPFYIRKRDLLEKSLNSFELFDFTLIRSDIRRDQPDSDEESCPRELNSEEKTEKPRGCHNLYSCITKELFQDFTNYEALKKRMNTTIRNKIEKLWEQNLDIFSHQLDAFFQKIEDLNRWFCDEAYSPSTDEMMRCAEWIQNFMILHAMFFFYINQDSSLIKKGCTASGSETCGWAYVNQRVANALLNLKEIEKDVLSSRRDFYRMVDKLMFIPTITEEAWTDIRKHRCSVAELMLPKKHFAVFATRRSRFDPWKHILVKLYPLSKGSALLYKSNHAVGSPNILNCVPSTEGKPNIFDVLRYQPKDKVECAARWAFLDHWFYLYISEISKEWQIQDTVNPSGDGVRVVEEIWGMPITRWIIRRLPSIALGADQEGNNRMNVLAPQVQPHIFYDARMLRLLIERMKDKYLHFHAQRFVTTVWDGLDDLACKNMSTNILTVNRGIIPSESKKNQMPLAFGSLLPQPISLNMVPAPSADSDTMPSPSTEEYSPKVVRTFFDLLDAIRECYQGIGIVPDFGLEHLHRLMKEFHNIQELQPFHGGYRKSDHRIVQLLQSYCTKGPETIDRNLMARNPVVLEENIKAIYTSIINEAPSFDSTRKNVSYTDIKIPFDRQTFMCAFFLYLYNLKVDDLPDDLKKEIAKELYGADTKKELTLKPYEDEEKLSKPFAESRSAHEYCTHWVRTDFRNAFLEHICDWYWETVWKKGRANSFLTFTKYLLITPKTKQELEALYRTQMRRVFCAAIDGVDTKYLK